MVARVRLKMRGCIAAIAVALLMTGCGSSGGGSYSYADSTNSAVKSDMTAGADINAGFSDTSGYDMYNSYEDADGSYNSEAEDYSAEKAEPNIPDTKTDSKTKDVELLEDKLIYKCNLTIETLNYDDTYQGLQGLIEKYGGRIESEYFTNNDGATVWRNDVQYSNSKYGDILIRVPSSNYKAFVEESGSLGNLLSKQSSIENITQEYYDNKALIKGLKTQEQRLLEMMETATEIEDLIQLNSELSDLQYRINNMETQIRTMDMDVAYSYIDVSIQEVVELTEVEERQKRNTFLDRLVNTCKDSWERLLSLLEGLAFGIISILPDIIVIAIVVIIVRLLFWRKLKGFIVRKMSISNGNASLKDLNDMLSQIDENKKKIEEMRRRSEERTQSLQEAVASTECTGTKANDGLTKDSGSSES